MSQLTEYDREILHQSMHLLFDRMATVLVLAFNHIHCCAARTSPAAGDKSHTLRTIHSQPDILINNAGLALGTAPTQVPDVCLSLCMWVAFRVCLGASSVSMSSLPASLSCSA